MGRSKQARGNSSSTDPQSDNVPTKAWLDDQVRQLLNLEGLGCTRKDPVVHLRTGRPKSPLPPVLAKVQQNHGWLPKIVPDPAYSENPTLENFYRHEQRVFVCLPHVSAVTAVTGALMTVGLWLLVASY